MMDDLSKVILPRFSEIALSSVALTLSFSLNSGWLNINLLSEGIDKELDEILLLVGVASKYRSNNFVKIILLWRRRAIYHDEGNAESLGWYNLCYYQLINCLAIPRSGEYKLSLNVHLMSQARWRTRRSGRCERVLILILENACGPISCESTKSLSDYIFTRISREVCNNGTSGVEDVPGMKFFLVLLSRLSKNSFSEVSKLLTSIVSNWIPVWGVKKAMDIVVLFKKLDIESQLGTRERFKELLKFVNCMTDIYSSSVGKRCRISLARCISVILDPLAHVSFSSADYADLSNIISPILQHTKRYLSKSNDSVYLDLILDSLVCYSRLDHIAEHIKEIICLCYKFVERNIPRKWTIYRISRLLCVYVVKGHTKESDEFKKNLLDIMKILWNICLKLRSECILKISAFMPFMQAFLVISEYLPHFALRIVSEIAYFQISDTQACSNLNKNPSIITRLVPGQSSSTKLESNRNANAGLLDGPNSHNLSETFLELSRTKSEKLSTGVLGTVMSFNSLCQSIAPRLKFSDQYDSLKDNVHYNGKISLILLLQSYIIIYKTSLKRCLLIEKNDNASKLEDNFDEIPLNALQGPNFEYPKTFGNIFGILECAEGFNFSYEKYDMGNESAKLLRMVKNLFYNWLNNPFWQEKFQESIEKCDEYDLSPKCPNIDELTEYSSPTSSKCNENYPEIIRNYIKVSDYINNQEEKPPNNIKLKDLRRLLCRVILSLREVDKKLSGTYSNLSMRLHSSYNIPISYMGNDISSFPIARCGICRCNTGKRAQPANVTRREADQSHGKLPKKFNPTHTDQNCRCANDVNTILKLTILDSLPILYPYKKHHDEFCKCLGESLIHSDPAIRTAALNAAIRTIRVQIDSPAVAKWYHGIEDHSILSFSGSFIIKVINSALCATMKSANVKSSGSSTGGFLLELNAIADAQLGLMKELVELMSQVKILENEVNEKGEIVLELVAARDTDSWKSIDILEGYAILFLASGSVELRLKSIEILETIENICNIVSKSFGVNLTREIEDSPGKYLEEKHANPKEIIEILNSLRLVQDFKVIRALEELTMSNMVDHYSGFIDSDCYSETGAICVGNKYCFLNISNYKGILQNNLKSFCTSVKEDHIVLWNAVLPFFLRICSEFLPLETTKSFYELMFIFAYYINKELYAFNKSRAKSSYSESVDNLTNLENPSKVLKNRTQDSRLSQKAFRENLNRNFRCDIFRVQWSLIMGTLFSLIHLVSCKGGRLDFIGNLSCKSSSYCKTESSKLFLESINSLETHKIKINNSIEDMLYILLIPMKLETGILKDLIILNLRFASPLSCASFAVVLSEYLGEFSEQTSLFGTSEEEYRSIRESSAIISCTDRNSDKIDNTIRLIHTLLHIKPLLKYERVRKSPAFLELAAGYLPRIYRCTHEYTKRGVIGLIPKLQLAFATYLSFLHGLVETRSSASEKEDFATRLIFPFHLKVSFTEMLKKWILECGEPKSHPSQEQRKRDNEENFDVFRQKSYPKNISTMNLMVQKQLICIACLNCIANLCKGGFSDGSNGNIMVYVKNVIEVISYAFFCEYTKFRVLATEILYNLLVFNMNHKVINYVVEICCTSVVCEQFIGYFLCLSKFLHKFPNQNVSPQMLSIALYHLSSPTIAIQAVALILVSRLVYSGNGGVVKLLFNNKPPKTYHKESCELDTNVEKILDAACIMGLPHSAQVQENLAKFIVQIDKCFRFSISTLLRQSSIVDRVSRSLLNIRPDLRFGTFLGLVNLDVNGCDTKYYNSMKNLFKCIIPIIEKTNLYSLSDEAGESCNLEDDKSFSKNGILVGVCARNMLEGMMYLTYKFHKTLSSFVCDMWNSLISVSYNDLSSDEKFDQKVAKNNIKTIMEFLFDMITTMKQETIDCTNVILGYISDSKFKSVALEYLLSYITPKHVIAIEYNAKAKNSGLEPALCRKTAPSIGRHITNVPKKKEPLKDKFSLCKFAFELLRNFTGGTKEDERRLFITILHVNLLYLDCKSILASYDYLVSLLIDNIDIPTHTLNTEISKLCECFEEYLTYIMSKGNKDSEADIQDLTHGDFLEQIVSNIVSLFKVSQKMKDEWGETALYWGSESEDHELSVKSFRIMRIIAPKLTTRSISVLENKFKKVQNSNGSITNYNEILETIFDVVEACIENLDKSNKVEIVSIFNFLCPYVKSRSTQTHKALISAMSKLILRINEFGGHTDAIIKTIMDDSQKIENFKNTVIDNALSAYCTEKDIVLMNILVSSSRTFYKLVDVDYILVILANIPILISKLGQAEDTSHSKSLDYKDAAHIARLMASIFENENCRVLQDIFMCYLKNMYRKEDEFIEKVVEGICSFYFPRLYSQIVFKILDLLMVMDLNDDILLLKIVVVLLSPKNLMNFSIFIKINVLLGKVFALMRKKFTKGFLKMLENILSCIYSNADKYKENYCVPDVENPLDIDNAKLLNLLENNERTKLHKNPPWRLGSLKRVNPRTNVREIFPNWSSICSHTAEELNSKNTNVDTEDTANTSLIDFEELKECGNLSELKFHLCGDSYRNEMTDILETLNNFFETYNIRAPSSHACSTKAGASEISDKPITKSKGDLQPDIIDTHRDESATEDATPGELSLGSTYGVIS